MYSTVYEGNGILVGLVENGNSKVYLNSPAFDEWREGKKKF
jgi:hypothetical protein